MPRATESKLQEVLSEWEGTDLYRFFAYAFGSPTTERFHWFRQEVLEVLLGDLWSSLDCPGEFPGLRFYDEYGDYESAYISLFDIGLPEPPVPLMESAHYKAQPAQQTAFENTLFYEVLGLKVDPSKSAPDSLLTQLEFLSAVRFAHENDAEGRAGDKGELRRLEQDFLKRHLLNWIPLAREKMEKQPASPFLALIVLLCAFLDRRFEDLRSAESAQAGPV